MRFSLSGALYQVVAFENLALGLLNFMSDIPTLVNCLIKLGLEGLISGIRVLKSTPNPSLT